MQTTQSAARTVDDTTGTDDKDREPADPRRTRGTPSICCFVAATHKQVTTTKKQDMKDPGLSVFSGDIFISNDDAR
jgi:hypothetical protein